MKKGYTVMHREAYMNNFIYVYNWKGHNEVDNVGYYDFQRNPPAKDKIVAIFHIKYKIPQP